MTIIEITYLRRINNVFGIHILGIITRNASNPKIPYYTRAQIFLPARYRLIIFILFIVFFFLIFKAATVILLSRGEIIILYSRAY